MDATWSISEQNEALAYAVFIGFDSICRTRLRRGAISMDFAMKASGAG